MSLVLLDKLLLKAISLLPPASTTGGQQRGCGGGGREKGGVTRVVRVIEPMPLDEVLLAPFVDSLQRSMRGTHRGEGEENLLLLLLLSLRLSLRLDSPGIKNGTNLQQEGTIDSGDTGSTTERGGGGDPILIVRINVCIVLRINSRNCNKGGVRAMGRESTHHET